MFVIYLWPIADWQVPLFWVPSRRKSEVDITVPTSRILVLSNLFHNSSEQSSCAFEVSFLNKPNGIIINIHTYTRQHSTKIMVNVNKKVAHILGSQYLGCSNFKNMFSALFSDWHFKKRKCVQLWPVPIRRVKSVLPNERTQGLAEPSYNHVWNHFTSPTPFKSTQIFQNLHLPLR